MRVLFCKIHCPSFICFCKPSASLLYTAAGPLKLESRPHVPSSTTATTTTTATVISVAITDSINEVIEESLDVVVDEKQSQGLKSSLKKSSLLDSEQVDEKKKKTVQWMDLLGKELVQIREFESRL
ncbi:hypothetical protein RCOM_0343080 [Ricinus communis]|uniref:Uncharacterized protein n=1 Tax=Ricinus communis TaxID=3988 RepID=B9SBP2_RICCO|nr:hypothetical protein RCOM_0343080 [Ricinus communis]